MVRKSAPTAVQPSPDAGLERLHGGHGHGYRAGSVEDVAHLTMIWSALAMRRSGPGQLKSLADEGATLPQIVALHVLRFEGPCTMQHLVDQLGLTPSTISHLVQRLVESGDAVRVEDELDRRQKRLSLTPQGIARTDQMMEARRDEVRASIVPLSASTRQELAAVLRKVVSELTATGTAHSNRVSTATSSRATQAPTPSRAATATPAKTSRAVRVRTPRTKEST